MTDHIDTHNVQQEQPSFIFNVFMRFISPRFNDELNQWFSSIPFISAFVQIIITVIGVLWGILKMLGIASESDVVQRGGCGASIFVLVQFALGFLLVFAFLSGFVTSIVMIGLLVRSIPSLMPLFLGICLLGSLLKNTFKVQAVGSHYDFKLWYRFAMGFTALLSLTGIVYIFKMNDADLLMQTGLADMEVIFLPVVAVASIIFIFHGFIKPLVTSFLIIYIALVAKADNKTIELLRERKAKIDHTMGKARTVLAAFRYLIIFTGILFFALLAYSDELGVSHDLQLYLDIPIPTPLAYQGVYSIVIAFWVSVLLWFSFISIFSPQMSIIAKLMRLFKRSSANASGVIIGLGGLTLLATLYTLNNDLSVFPNDQQARETESVIYKKIQRMELLSKYHSSWKLSKYNSSWKKESLPPKPAWIQELASQVYVLHKQAGTLEQVNLNISSDFDRKLHKNEANFYTQKIVNKVIPGAIRTLFNVCLVVISGVGGAMLLGAFTKNYQHLSAYVVSMVVIPFVFMFMVTASDEVIIEFKDELTQKATFIFSTGD